MNENSHSHCPPAGASSERVFPVVWNVSCPLIDASPHWVSLSPRPSAASRAQRSASARVHWVRPVLVSPRMVFCGAQNVGILHARGPRGGAGVSRASRWWSRASRAASRRRALRPELSASIVAFRSLLDRCCSALSLVFVRLCSLSPANQGVARLGDGVRHHPGVLYATFWLPAGTSDLANLILTCPGCQVQDLARSCFAQCRAGLVSSGTRCERICESKLIFWKCPGSENMSSGWSAPTDILALCSVSRAQYCSFSSCKNYRTS